jgi:hypothetical protein
MNKYKVADTVLTILVVVIAIAAVVAAAVFTVRWLAAHQEPEGRVYKSVKIYEQELVATPKAVDRDNVIGVYFKALESFSGIDITCSASENSSIDIYLYNFVTDYSTTLLGEVIESASFNDYSDGAKLAVGYGTLPAGEYLVVFSSKTNALMSCGDYQSKEADNSVVVYENGNLLLNCVPYMSVIFDAESEDGTYFG